MKAKVNDELKQHFRPEFLNRVDDTIVFPQLSQDEIIQIVDLMIAKVDERLRDKDMGIELTQAAKVLPRDARATTRFSVPGRCAGRSSATSRTRCPRRSSTASSSRARSSWSTSRARPSGPCSPSRVRPAPRCPTSRRSRRPLRPRSTTAPSAPPRPANRPGALLRQHDTAPASLRERGPCPIARPVPAGPVVTGLRSARSGRHGRGERGPAAALAAAGDRSPTGLHLRERELLTAAG